MGVIELYCDKCGLPFHDLYENPGKFSFNLGEAVIEYENKSKKNIINYNSYGSFTNVKTKRSIQVSNLLYSGNQTIQLYHKNCQKHLKHIDQLPEQIRIFFKKAQDQFFDEDIYFKKIYKNHQLPSLKSSIKLKNKILNPLTGRLVLAKGKLGKVIQQLQWKK